MKECHLDRRSFLQGSIAAFGGFFLLHGTAFAGPRAFYLPDVKLSWVNGAPFRLSELKGEVLLVNFWASWCGPCVAELPLLEQLHLRLKYDQGIRVLTVNVDENADSLVLGRYWSQSGYKMAAALDMDGGAARRFRIAALPTTWIVDGTGLVRDSIEGAQDWGDEKWVNHLRDLRSEATFHKK